MTSRLPLTLVFVLSFLFGTKDGGAQITGVTLDSCFEYSPSYCSIPAAVGAHFGGYASGTPSATDSITGYINFGDGFDTTFRLPLFPVPGQNTDFAIFMAHEYPTPGTYTILYAATADNGMTDTVLGSLLNYNTTCNNLSGYLYMDANNNCVKDAGDDPIPGIAVSITGGGSSYLVWTDSFGYYTITLPTGINYTITPSVSSFFFTASCPSTGSANVLLNAATISSFAYSVASQPLSTDYSIYGWGTGWRLNETRNFMISAMGNSMSGGLPATITATLPAGLSYVGTIAGPTPAVSGNVLTWSVSSISIGSGSFFTTLEIFCDSSIANMGDTLCIGVQVSTTPPDANPANNNNQVCAIVTNSYDPNDKDVSPKGIGTDGAITNGTRLTYLVRFQNTGNDVAYDVTVKDMIDEDLDLSSLQIIKTSHPMYLGLSGRELSFRFDDINLPDSGSNEPASHGYIMYAVSPNANLPLGTVINNEAKIYFDYNPAIITNTTYNVIAAPQSVQHISNGSVVAVVAPNPAGNVVNIEVKNEDSFQALVYDMMGRLVSMAAGENGKAAVSVADMPDGTYLLHLNSGAGKTLTTRISVLH